MKKWLFFLLPAIAAVHAHAQSWNISADGGLVWNTKPTNPLSMDHASVLGSCGGLRGSYTRNQWEIGLGIDFRRYSIREIGDGFTEDEFDPLTGTLKPGAVPVHFDFAFAIPSLTFAPFIHRHFGDERRLDPYAGISAGYSILLNKVSNDPYGSVRYTKGASAFSPGAQAGAAYQLAGHLYLTAELGIYGVISRPFTFGAASFTAGMKLKL